MLPNLFERSLNLNRFYKYNRTSKNLIILKLKLISQKQNFLNIIEINQNLGRLVLNHSTNIEGLIPILQKLALDVNIKTITPAAISRARGRSSKLIIRLSVKTINGYKAIARKGKTAQEVFISTDLSKDELKSIIDIYNRKNLEKKN